MKIPRFYINSPLSVNDSIDLPKEIHRHAIQVLRLNRGEVLILFNGTGGEYIAEIQYADKRKSQVTIQSFHDINRESNLTTRLVLSLIKPDKMDFAIQKAVELGVNSIQPISSDRSVVHIKQNQIEKKLTRWKNIIISACEQSGRTAIPTIAAPITLSDYLASETANQQIIMHPEATQTISDIHLHDEIDLLVGPEGGFTDNEVALCKQHNIQTIRFGARTLRAETAAIAGLSLLQSYSNNL